MSIGTTIKHFRREKNITQEQLAEMLGITSRAVSQWECDRTLPDITLIVPIAKIFNITTDELLGVDRETTDEKLKKYNDAYNELRNSEDCNLSYWWAKEAVADFPDNYVYIEWLANSEYKQAFEENKKKDASVDYFDELTENALRRYEYIIENCSDCNTVSLAALGKITLLRFIERTEEADWSAEFEYSDENIKTAEQALHLTREGRELLDYVSAETK